MWPTIIVVKMIVNVTSWQHSDYVKSLPEICIVLATVYGCCEMMKKWELNTWNKYLKTAIEHVILANYKKIKIRSCSSISVRLTVWTIVRNERKDRSDMFFETKLKKRQFLYNSLRRHVRYLHSTIHINWSGIRNDCTLRCHHRPVTMKRFFHFNFKTKFAK